jgi:hypothetical protein
LSGEGRELSAGQTPERVKEALDRTVTGIGYHPLYADIHNQNICKEFIFTLKILLD